MLDLKTYFNGDLTAHGMFSDRSGKVVRRFVVTMKCHWEGSDGVLDESFVYSDGEKQRRVWRLKQLADGRYPGAADDVVGEAKGQSAGNAFQWGYTLRLPATARPTRVAVRLLIYLIDEPVSQQGGDGKFWLRLGEFHWPFQALMKSAAPGLTMPLNAPVTDWSEHVVWLVGASSGIGLAVAKLLHTSGAKVVVSARNAVALAEFESAHAGSLGIALDATDREAMRGAARRIVEQFGRIDLAFYCAGYYKPLARHAFDHRRDLRHERSTTSGRFTCSMRCCLCCWVSDRGTSVWCRAWPATAVCQTHWPTDPPKRR